MTESIAHRDPLEELAEEFMARLRQGERLSLAEYAAAHPALADEILALFPALQMLEQVKPGGTEPDLPLPSPDLPPAMLGDYRILREIGRGGMAVVYEAEHLSLGRHVALKVLPAAGESMRLLRFRREARSAARLHHTNIVPVFDVGSAGGVHYYAMQFIRGQGLDEVLRELLRLRSGAKPTDAPAADLTVSLADGLRTGVFDAAAYAPVPKPAGPDPSAILTGSASHYFRSVAELGVQAAEALAYAHGQRVLHRDVKPSNLLLDRQGTLWLTDFGLAKDDSDDLTRTGDVVGTLRYMAPERFKGVSDPRSDVYALGVTLYEMLTLRPAFPEADRLQLVRRIEQDDPPRPRLLDPTIPRDLETVVLKAIEKVPDRRYATAADLADDLRRFLADRPIRARRASWREQGWRWCRRNPAVALLLAAVVASSAAGTVAASAYAARADAARWDAEGKRVDAENARTAEEVERKKADTARAAEEAERKKADAMVQFFLTRVFTAARPKGQDGGLGKGVTLRDAIVAALPAVSAEFADQPLVEMRLRHTLGHTLLQLGEPGLAVEQLELARDIAVERLPPDDPRTLSCGQGLTVGYNTLGRNAEAVRLGEVVLAACRRTLPPDDTRTLNTLNSLAGAYQALAQNDKSLPLVQEALAGCERSLPPDDPLTLAVRSNLANEHAARGQHADAVKLREAVRDANRKALPPDHPDALAGMYNLANSYHALGRHADALAIRKEVLAAYKRMLPADHPDLLGAIESLASSYAALGRPAVALPLYEEAVAGAKRALPADHPRTLQFMQGLADCYRDLDRPADALKLGREVLAARRRVLPADHPHTLESLEGVAVSTAALGRTEAARELFEEVLAAHRKAFPADDPRTLMSVYNLAHCHIELGRYADALKLHEEALAGRRKALPPDHPHTLTSLSAVAALRVKLGRGAEAVPLLDEGLEQAVGKTLDPLIPFSLAATRLQHFVASDDPAGCRATAELWEKLDLKTADALYAAARMRAVAAGVYAKAAKPDDADADADRAMAWLTKAVDAGFKNRALLARHKDLDVLRDRADFKKLLASLPAEPPPPPKGKSDR